MPALRAVRDDEKSWFDIIVPMRRAHALLDNPPRPSPVRPARGGHVPPAPVRPSPVRPPTRRPAPMRVRGEGVGIVPGILNAPPDPADVREWLEDAADEIGRLLDKAKSFAASKAADGRASAKALAKHARDAAAAAYRKARELGLDIAGRFQELKTDAARLAGSAIATAVVWYALIVYLAGSGKVW